MVPSPSNRFDADDVHGLDLVEDLDKKVKYCKLGFEKLPYEDSTFDYVTAYDLIEHIPRYSENSSLTDTPFIFLMNEILEFSKTRVYSYHRRQFTRFLELFKILTIILLLLIRLKCIFQKRVIISKHYGISSKFNVLYQKMYYQHLVAVLEKDIT